MANTENATAVRRLVAMYRKADREALTIGREWYPDARATAAAIGEPFGCPTDRAAAIIAVLSPQTRWRENVRAAAQVIAHVYGDRPLGQLPGYPTNHRKALAIANGAPIGTGPGDGLGAEAPKVRHFWRAICGDRESVTLDIWAMRAAFPADTGGPPKGARYARCERAYAAAAEHCGESARDFQAIVWTCARGIREHLKDQSDAGAIVALAS